jgi:hypothetical protein
MSVPVAEVRCLAWRAAGCAWGEGEACRTLLRDVFGNPFRPPAIDPNWLAWHEGVVARMARDLHDRRCFGEMPVLGDALEDAGCTDEVILSHCRAGGLHARGCWLLDLILRPTGPDVAR